MANRRSNDIQTTQQRFRREAWPLLPSVLRVATVLTGDPHRAEDLAQETMLRAYRHIHTFQSGTNMHAWLMTILRRTHVDIYRKESRQIDACSIDAIDAVPSTSRTPHDDFADNEWTNPQAILERFDDAEIEQALRSLPEPMRWVLLLVDVEQFSTAEAAEALDVAQGTIKSRASRARAMLKEALTPLALNRGLITGTPGEQL